MVSLSNKILVGFSLDFLLHYFNNSTNFKVFSIQCISWLLGLSHRQFTLGTSFRQEVEKGGPYPEEVLSSIYEFYSVYSCWSHWALCLQCVFLLVTVGSQFTVCIPAGHIGLRLQCVFLLVLGSHGYFSLDEKLNGLYYIVQRDVLVVRW